MWDLYPSPLGSWGRTLCLLSNYSPDFLNNYFGKTLLKLYLISDTDFKSISHTHTHTHTHIHVYIYIYAQTAGGTRTHAHTHTHTHIYIYIYIFSRQEKKFCKEILNCWNILKRWLVVWVLWHINLCRLFNAKSIFIWIISSILNNSV